MNGYSRAHRYGSSFRMFGLAQVSRLKPERLLAAMIGFADLEKNGRRKRGDQVLIMVRYLGESLQDVLKVHEKLYCIV